MIKSRIATTDELKKLIEVAEQREYNRLPAEWVEHKLDPLGKHILGFVLTHEHAGGKRVAPHYRCIVLAKLQGRREPTMFLLDCDIDLFEALSDQEEWELN